MIENGATVTPQIDSLSRSVYAERDERPGLVTWLSQGIVVGALFSFLFVVMAMLSNPSNGYNFLLIAWLPFFLACGTAFGVLEGTGLWACSYIAGRRLHALVRIVLGMVILAILLAGTGFIFAEAASTDDTSRQEALLLIAFYSAAGAVFGLVSGSRFRPLAELLRGSTSPRLRVPAAITGFILRVLVVYLLMDVILMAIWFSQRDFHRKEFGFVAIALVHLLAALVIIFLRMPFWLLLPLALIINFPIALVITEVLTNAQNAERYLIIAYLTLWAAFLLTRVSVPHAARDFIKKELRYYLID